MLSCCSLAKQGIVELCKKYLAFGSWRQASCDSMEFSMHLFILLLSRVNPAWVELCAARVRRYPARGKLFQN